MRLPTVRLSTRHIMMAVAILGLIFGGVVETRRRGERFQVLADYHWRKCGYMLVGFEPQALTPHYAWHEQMSLKYRDAATHPWFPVVTDPPRPLENCKRPCLCGVRVSANGSGLKREFLEREGWITNEGELLEDETRFFTSARRGEERIRSEGATQDEAWRKAFDQARSFGVRLPTLHQS